MTARGGSTIFEVIPPRRRRRRRTIRGWNGCGSTRIARQRHRPGDGGRDHARGLRADPIAGGAPRLGHLPAPGAARGLAPRPDPGAGRGGRGRALVGIFLLFAVLQLLPRAAERNPQSRVVLGGRRGTSHLANSMKTQTEIARKREKEMGDLYAFSRRLAAASSAADIYLAIEQHLASLVQRKVVLFGTGSGGDRDAKPDQGALSQRVHSAIAEVQAGRTATTVDDGADIWLVRRVSQKNADFGVIAIDLGSVRPSDIDEVRKRVNDVLSDAAATLERLD